MTRTRIAAIAFLLLLWAGAATWAEDKYCSVHFVVVKESNGKPIRNAAIVLHPVNKKGHQEKGGLELKADADGKTQFDSVPYGKLRIQVIAPGYQTFGQDFEITQPEQEVVIKMKRPAEQYSIYDKKEAKKDSSADEPPKDEPPKNEAPK